MTIVIILHVALCVFLVGVILLQPGKSDSGIGFGSTSQSIFGSRGAGNLLTRTTAFVAFFFLITSFFLARERVAESTGSVVSETNAPAQANPGASGAAPGAAASTQTPPPVENKPAEAAGNANPATPPADAKKK